MLNVKQIQDLFEEIALPCDNGQTSPKVEAVLKWFGDREISCTYIPGTGIIVNQQPQPRVVMISHIDLVSTFVKGFAENKSFKIEVVNERELIVGALDNTLTNAIGMLVIEEILDKNPLANIEFVLTEYEECGLIGVSNYLETNKDRVNDSFFVNLDVTNDGYGSIASIEYDKPNLYVLNDVKSLLKDLDVHIQPTRFTDDTSAIVSKGFSGFSYCIPTDNYCHSYDSTAYVDTLVPYSEGLTFLLSNLFKPKGYEIMSRKEVSENFFID